MTNTAKAFTFALDQAVYHQGPVTVYMSKAPGAASAYAGDGDWFKIAEEGPTFSGGSATWPMRASYTYSIPTCIADGDYLLRIEQLGIHNPGSPPQFYISCAQVTVSGGSGGSPSPTTKIPGHVKATDPGYTANVSTTVPGWTLLVVTCCADSCACRSTTTSTATPSLAPRRWVIES